MRGPIPVIVLTKKMSRKARPKIRPNVITVIVLMEENGMVRILWYNTSKRVGAKKLALYMKNIT
jgi:hypothetical protein